MNRPRIPPTSATRDSKDAASSSVSRMRVLLANTMFSMVMLSAPYVVETGSSAN